MNTTFYYTGEEQAFLSALNLQKYKQIILLADAKTNGFCLPVLKKIIPALADTNTMIIPDGEQNKNMEVCSLIWQQLIALNAGKNTLLINVGGGMVSDMGGFVASVYKRGVSFVNIPTTLLAMVDASQGGKTGIDFDGIKNMIGTYQHPLAVYINPVFLNTLAEHNLRSGIAEMLKHALLQGNPLLSEMLRFNTSDFFQSAAIKSSVLFKGSIVLQDPKDEHIRQTLNLGHTIGHAVESFSLQCGHPLLHGEAVMLGLICELLLSHILFDLPKSIIEEVVEFKNRIFPDINQRFSYEDIERFLWNDKKNNTEIRMSLLSRVGACKWQVAVSSAQIKEAISLMHSLNVK